MSATTFEGQALYLTPTEAAAFLRTISARTLARLRIKGGGPRYRRHGREALYTREDLEAWSNGRAFKSTAEEGVVKKERAQELA